MIFDHSLGRLWLARFNHFFHPSAWYYSRCQEEGESKTNEVLVHVWLVCIGLFICLSAVGLNLEI